MNARDILMEVRAEHGVLTPAILVLVATPADHPFHSRFEWDDKIAGPLYRLHQAHKIIVSVKTSFPSDDPAEERTVRAFQAVRGDNVNSYVYDPAEEVALDPLRRTMLLREMEREWSVLRKRYERFAEFVELVRRDLDAA